jgi:Kef-type K+ transport system membrane component KefB
MDTFTELSIILLLAALVSCAMRLLRQPLVVGYIVTGLIVGPYALNILHSTHDIELFSKIGISILLFIVGLNLNPDVVREVGKVSVVTGVGQVVFTSLVGFFLVKALGYSNVAAMYVAVALTFSSTIIVLKILSDKGDLFKLYGRISIGFLLVQDLIATLILVIISAVGASHGTGIVGMLSILALKGVAVSVVFYFLSRYALPRVVAYLASSQELLFLFSIGWGLALASLFYTLGFSVEIGALVAGVTLSLTPFAIEISSRMKPLRDFFVVLFFILLGSQLSLNNIGSLILPAIILSAFVLIGNPIIMFVLMNIFGFKRKTGFMTGLTVAQISEFSLILIALGYSQGHITRDVVSLVTLVGIVTIAGSTYLMLYGDEIYEKVSKFLSLIEFKHTRGREKGSGNTINEIVIFGYDRVGIDFVRAAQKVTGRYVVVDFDPTTIKLLEEKGIPHKYGDAEDPEFLQEIELGGARLVVSTVPDFKANLLLVKTYRTVNPKGIIMVLSHDIEHAKELYLAGATYVLMPHYLGAHHASDMIVKYGFSEIEFERERNIHLSRLSKRDSR